MKALAYALAALYAALWLLVALEQLIYNVVYSDAVERRLGPWW